MTPIPTSAIIAQGVRKRYGDVEALAGVDVEVERSEVLAVLGPNGAGKTTLVEILEGLRRRDSGEISVLGVDPASAPRSWRARIGAVLQLGTETDELTVAEMVAAYASYYPRPRHPAELLEALDLCQQRDRRVRQLSGGQRRRLDLALGMIGNPELLFLDEPTTGLDPEVRLRIWEFVSHLASRGTTILLTTHYMEEAEHLADRVTVLVDGRVVADGSPRSLAGATATLVTFRRPAGPNAVRLPETIAPESITQSGPTISIATESPTTTMAALLGWAEEEGVELDDLTVERKGLERAYLDLLTHLDTRKEVNA